MVRILIKHRVQIKAEGNHKYNRMTGVLNRRDGARVWCKSVAPRFVLATCFGTADGSMKSRLEK